jgi:thymidylate kinase
MMTRQRCSEPGTVHAQLIVLEGMPGAGKTTAAAALRQQGRQVIGEYTDTAGATVAIGEHPRVEDDDAHQANWIRKASQCKTALGTGVVYADRDWISSLAYAYSAAAADSGALLHRRCTWAAESLRDGRLLLPGAYVIFDLDPQASLQRRARRLRPGHPWSYPGPLERLRGFYAAPADALSKTHPGLADTIASVPSLILSGHDNLQASLRQLTALARAS